MLLLVKISPRMSRKVALPEVPELVEEWQNILKEKLQLQGSFTLQYEDSDFNNALCNLIDIHDLPPELAILHILWDETTPLVQQESDSVVFPGHSRCIQQRVTPESLSFHQELYAKCLRVAFTIFYPVLLLRCGVEVVQRQ